MLLINLVDVMQDAITLESRKARTFASTRSRRYLHHECYVECCRREEVVESIANVYQMIRSVIIDLRMPICLFCF